MPFSKYFEHGQCEKDIYQAWDEADAFKADPHSDRPPFVISMPPPNATGTLHLGHAIGMAIEDIMIRWRRMAGDEALWVPGTDHAAIASESVVIRKLQAEGMDDPRGELGRDGLVRRIAEFTEQSRETIRSQIRALGASCDWSIERYTMDPALSRCVNSVFARMFADGLIYRAPRIVNWDPTLQTTVSDDEVFHREQQAEFFTLRYGPFLVGTSRPETKLGDTGVAVHPDDERWNQHIGKTYSVEWPKGPTITVKVVGDKRVDPETGTGALGVTPAHSQVDFEIARDHNLPLLQVVGEDGRMTSAAGPYARMTVLECRKAFADDLQEAGLLAKKEVYSQPISLCYRSKQPIEPLPKSQWFIDVNRPAVLWEGRVLSFRQVLRSVVESGRVRILPQHEVKTYDHWIDNLRDWCISRQIWWGHRVPVWYRGAQLSRDGDISRSQEMYVGHRRPEGEGWIQDPDTLDTWFSSALWTWSTLVDAKLALNPEMDLAEILEGSPYLKRFHPTSVMETGYDILFFWVARMILMTTYTLGEVPFHTVYLHGLILDRDGEKMSKSKPETSIDPLETIREHGADALRLALVLGNSAGSDLRLGQERIVACKRLINKLWNAAKLVEARTKDHSISANEQDEVSHPFNRWMLSRRNALVDLIERRMQSYAFGDAAEHIRTSFWGEFCDFYLEGIKGDELATLPETTRVLSRVFADYLHLFHPFMPFVTEQCWRGLERPGLLMQSPWPKVEKREDWAEDSEGVEAVLRSVTALRSLRAEQGLDASAKVDVAIHPTEHQRIFESCRSLIERLARTSSLEIGASDPNAASDETSSSVSVDPAFVLRMSLPQADRAAERGRLEKQMEGSQRRLASLQKRLDNPGFLANAAPDTIESARRDAEKVRGSIEEIGQRLKALQ